MGKGERDSNKGNIVCRKPKIWEKSWVVWENSSSGCGQGLKWAEIQEWKNMAGNDSEGLEKLLRGFKV